MHERAVERLQLETDLRRAIEREEFTAAVPANRVPPRSPGHRIRSADSVATPASEGLLSPAAFLKVAEETGLITRIDHWVLREACAQARRWQTIVPRRRSSVSVNISAQGFGQPDIVRHVADTLEETGLDPHNLRLEITESVAMADAERAA